MTDTPSKPTFLSLLEDMMNDHLGKAEFVKAFENVVKRVEKIDERTAQDVEALANTLLSKFDEHQGVSKSDLEKFKSDVLTTLNTETAQKLGAMEAKITAAVEHALSLRDGIDADEEKIVSEVLARIVMPEVRNPIMDTKEELRDKLESLEGEERLKMTAIDGLDEWLTKNIGEIKASIPSRGGTPQGLRFYIDGVKKGIISNVNFVGGTNLAIAHSKVNGQDTFTFNASGGGPGGLTVETPTGTVDGSNTIFTVTAEPQWVVADGITYYAGAGYSYNALTITMDVAPSASIRSIA